MIHIQQFTFNAFQTRCCALWDETGSCAFVDPGCSTPSELSELTGFVSARGLKPVCIMLTHGHFDHIYGVSELSRLYGGLPVYMHADEMYSLEKTNPYVCKVYGLPLPDLTFAGGTMKPETSPSAEGSGMNTGDGPEMNGGLVTVEGSGSNTADGPDMNGGLVTVVEGDVISVGGLRFEVIETPGHSRGGLCFFERTERVLFSGDTLFAGAIGRSDHPGGDYDALISSINEKLLPLDDAPASGAGAGSGPVSASCASSGSGSSSASGSGSVRHTSVSVIPGHGPCTDLATEGMTNPFLQPFNLPYDDE